MEATTCKYLEVAHIPLKEIKLSLGIHEVGRTKELTAPSLLSTKCFDYFEVGWSINGPHFDRPVTHHLSRGVLFDFTVKTLGFGNFVRLTGRSPVAGCTFDSRVLYLT